MKDLSKFQLIILIVFGVFIVIGVIVFALQRGSSTQAVNLTVWGTMPQREFNEVMSITGLNENEEFKITYTEKNESSFSIEFLEALASNRGPDLFFLSSDSILKNQERALVIPFQSFSERSFLNSFVEAGEVFLLDSGIIALPVSIDPLVMYWNRDIFSSAGLVEPPRFWDELYDLSVLLTKKNGDLNISQSAVALGEYANITNAFEILSTLIMQAGNPISQKMQQGGVVSLLNQNMGLPAMPAERALSFYTDFSNPLRAFYTWNRSLPWSKDHFISGDLAIYFGFASELFDIQDKNPNLNFDVASIPQSKESSRKITYGEVLALAINKNSPRVGDAFNFASIFSGRESVLALSRVKNLPPVRRDLLVEKPNRAYMEVFYEGAIISKTWLMPDRVEAGLVFKNMVESVTGGRNRPMEAVVNANRDLNFLFEN